MILASHGIIGSQIVQATGLLAEYPGAAAAYSLRQLTTAYTGSAIRVRIDTTGQPEYNIGFVDGELDVATLEGYCTGGLNAFVKTWYDQSGNIRDATQTTAANQPQIVSSGSVLTLTGLGSAKPILRFDGLNDSLNFSTITAPQFTSFYPSKKAQSNSLSAWFTRSEGLASPYSPIIFGGANITIIGNQTRSTYSNSYNNNDYILMSGYINNSNNGFIQINNSAITLNLILGDPGTNGFNSINQRGSSNFSKCDVPEMILYDFDNSTNISAINTNINTYYGIY